MKNMATISSENLQNSKIRQPFCFSQAVFSLSKLKFPSNFQEGNLRIDFSCLIRTLTDAVTFKSQV
jgi:hypothetical protein